MRQAGDLNVGLVQEIGDVMSGALAVDRSVQRENDLADRRFMSPRNQRVDRQVFGSDAIERR